MSVAVIGAGAGLRVVNNELTYVGEVIYLAGGDREVISGVSVPTIGGAETAASFNTRVAQAIDAEAARLSLSAVTAIYGTGGIQKLR